MFKLFTKTHTAPPAPAPAPPRAVPLPTGLQPLAHAADAALEHHDLAGARLSLYLVLNRAYAARHDFEGSGAEHLAALTVALATRVGAAAVPMVFYDSHPYPMVELTPDRYAKVVTEQHQLHGGVVTMGSVQCAIGMRSVIEHYQQTGQTGPALAVFHVGGEPRDHDTARLQLAHASALPIHWSFVTAGNTERAFLDQLRHLPGRAVANTSYRHTSGRFSTVNTRDFYDGILHGVGAWLAAARTAGVLR